ncbi:sigma-70 family RNA polymerase sigma factor [Pedobacter duraquae]|uniref:RNA polymerase sigma-70 factor (ECF subfamily) n=1 Tax=Pedobacter duraquae TaxID=425511 RepID=A0A4R6IRE0_9SPHI|nr:sigma-70 family RNA polymerase sigma factor [Pedobacter duraquae]TDO24536.1 RNA polymerase sigma-70 factor (ECF subfamily) [Pedobacter duraquae]
MQLNATPGLKEINAKSYDLAQFESLYNAIASSLQKYAFYWVKDVESANAIVNDVFVQLWFKNDKPDQIKGYLYQSVKNASLNHLKKEKQLPVSFIDQDELTLIADLTMPLSEVVTESDKLSFLQNTIAQLPQRRQIVFRMFRLEGFSYIEIADLLQISVRTVEDHLGKAMQFIHARAKHLVNEDVTEL